MAALVRGEETHGLTKKFHSSFLVLRQSIALSFLPWLNARDDLPTV